jgi:hypothetical protein
MRSPGATTCSSTPCRPHTPGSERWRGSAFVALVPTRPGPRFGRPVHRRGSPHRFRPGASPQALRIPPRGGHPALLTATAEASGALPPLLEIAPPIRAPVELQPTCAPCGPAHTMPSADVCSAGRKESSTLSPFQDTRLISRGQLSYRRCIDARFIKHSPFVDGGLHGRVPARPDCTTPRSGFVSLAPHIRSTLPSDPTSR